MNVNLLGQLANNNGLLGLLLAIAIIAIVYLHKSLLAEKDKELKQDQEIIEKVTLVLRAIDETQRAILIDLERTHEEEKNHQQ